MQIAHRQLAAGHEHRVEHPAALGQILDVLVAAVLPRWRGPSRLGRRPIKRIPAQSAQHRVPGLGRKCQRGNTVGVSGDQRALAGIPPRQQFRGRRRPHQTRMHDPRESDTRDMPRRRRLPREVPNRLVRVGKLLGEETAAVHRREDPGVAPALTG
ncbi:Uncharacterised protein [Mycobacteroides abscessus subsp. massiliense]|nr:Uncharacterised protein [Mycobacteroides abscessus subsp. massiliense]